MESNGKATTKEAFLAANDRPLVRVPLDEALYGKDACFYVFVMTGDERSDFEARWMARDVKKQPGAFRWDLLFRTVVNELGEAIFNEKDREAAMGKSAPTMEKLFEKSCEVNALREKDVVELEKNSDSSQ